MSYFTLGQRIAANSLGLSNADYDLQKAAGAVNDVEHEDPQIREVATDFWKTFCQAFGEFEKQANGLSEDYFMLKALSEQPAWISEYQDLAQSYAERIVAGKQEAAAERLEKVASMVSALVPAVASRAASTTPSVLKGLLASGVGTGMAAGGLYWALQRAATEDSDKTLDNMQAKIDEYQKLKALLSTPDDENAEEEAAIQKKINSFG